MTLMKRLQPTTAPWVHIQALPEGYLLATGEHYSAKLSGTSTVRHYERITAYMPDRFGVCSSGDSDDDDAIEDAFREENCRGCDYYFDDQEGYCSEGQTDDAGNTIISCTVSSQCPSYNSNLCDVSWPCAAGYDEPDWGGGEDDFDMPPMAFAIDLSQQSLAVKEISAWVQRIAQDAGDGQWWTGDRLRAVNAYDTELVCWGNDNSKPSSLPEAVAMYCDAPANNDLLPISSFRSNAHQARHGSCRSGVIDALQVGPGYDALLLASATATPEAYLLLRASGFTATNGLIIAGLTADEHTLDDGTTVPAYLTDPVINGRSWLLIDNPAALDEGGERSGSQALLLGQIQSTSAQPTCDSLEPSSSELAAPAVC